MKNFVILLSMATLLLSTEVALANNALIEGEGPLLDEAAADDEIDLTEAFTEFLGTVGVVSPEKAKVKSTVTIDTSGIMPMAFGDHGVAWGDCHYYTTPEGIDQYRCIDQGTQNDIYAVGISDVNHDYVIACRSTNGGATYALVGYVMILSGVGNLVVYGNSRDNTVGIIRYRNTALPGTSCDFYTFQPWFSSLTIDGRAGEDEIWGSQYNDTSLKGEKVYGWEGNDNLYGQSKDGVMGSQLFGGSGSDTFYSSSTTTGIDFMYGHLSSTDLGTGDCNNQNNNDSFLVTTSAATIWAGFGNDYIYSTGKHIQAYGFTNDLASWEPYFGCDQDFIYGGSGWDKIDGGPDVDVIYGNGGNDFLVGGGGAYSANDVVDGVYDNIYAGAGDDIIWAGFVDNPNPSAWGSGYVKIWAGPGNDTINGGFTTDWVDCGTGVDYFDGFLPYGDLVNNIYYDADQVCGCTGEDYVVEAVNGLCPT